MRSHGFTLFELAAVFGLVSLLVALSVPAVRAMREAAADAKCKSNLREMALAAIAYAEEHRGAFPPAMRGFDDCWDFRRTRDGWKPGEMWAYASVPDSVLACPKCYGESDNYAGVGFTGYNYNTSFAGREDYGGGKSGMRLTLRRVRNPSRMALFGDAGYGDPESMNTFMRAPRVLRGYESSGSGIRKSGTQSFRHFGRSNVSFADGHVESLRQPYDISGNPRPQAGRTGFLSKGNALYCGDTF